MRHNRFTRILFENNKYSSPQVIKMIDSRVSPLGSDVDKIAPIFLLVKSLQLPLELELAVKLLT